MTNQYTLLLQALGRWQVHSGVDKWRCSALPAPSLAAPGTGEASRVMLKPCPRVEGRGVAAVGLTMTVTLATSMKLMLMALSHAPVCVCVT